MNFASVSRNAANGQATIGGGYTASAASGR